MMARLPYHWARVQRALIQRGAEGDVLIISGRTPAWALAEIRRRHGVLPVREVGDDELDTLLASIWRTDDP